MRRILPLAIIFAALSLSTTGVRADGTWCAHYGTGFGGMDCGFYSFEQCRATVSGVGASPCNCFFLGAGAMNFIEKSAITTKAYWLRVYRSRPNFAQ